MKPFFRVASLLLALCVNAHAESVTSGFFAGASVGSTQADFTNVDSAGSRVLTAGYFFPTSAWGMDLSYLDLGEARVDDTAITLEPSGFRVMVSYDASVGTTIPMNLFVKGGGYSMDTRLSGDDERDGNERSWGFAYTLGLEFFFTPRIAVGGELASHTGVDYVATEADATFLGVSVKFFP